MGKRFGYQYPHCHTITESNHHPNQFLRLQNLLSSPIFSSIQQSQLFLIGFQKKKNFGGPFSLTKQQKKKKKTWTLLSKWLGPPLIFMIHPIPAGQPSQQPLKIFKKKCKKEKRKKKRAVQNQTEQVKNEEKRKEKREVRQRQWEARLREIHTAAHATTTWERDPSRCPHHHLSRRVADGRPVLVNDQCRIPKQETATPTPPRPTRDPSCHRLLDLPSPTSLLQPSQFTSI